jgi:hypothetical protein
MAKFVKVGDRYINLDHVSHVAMQDKTLAICYKDYKGDAIATFCKPDDPGYQNLLTALQS